MKRYSFRAYSYTPATGELHIADGPTIVLRHKVNSLLNYLIERRTGPVSKQELLEALWQHGEYRENSLTQSVKELRKALGDSAQQPDYIRTFPQRGYQWIAATREDASGEEVIGEKVTGAEPDPSAEASALPLSQPALAKTRSPWRTRAFVAGMLMALVIGGLVWTGVSDGYKGSAHAAVEDSRPALMIFPFSNDTGDQSKQWLELGFADMLANHIQASAAVNVMPPAMTNGLLLSEELEGALLPNQIRSLLKQRQENYALLGSVRLHNGFQVLDFQLVHEDGRTQQGSVIYPSLPDATAAIAQQVVLLLEAGHESSLAVDADGKSAAHGLAGQALAEGINALYIAGPKRAQELFQAARLIDPDNPWVIAYLAQSAVMLADWQEASARLAELENSYQGVSQQLDAFQLYWQAELAQRQGDDARALEYFQALLPLIETQDIRLAAEAYNLRARLAWSARDWETHRLWLDKAHRVFPRSGDLRVEADKLYYLGSPIGDGLEEDPQLDLTMNRERLQKALNLYTQIGSQPMLAATHFALAQNYYNELAHRKESLQKAIALYEKTGQKLELVDTLIYASFFHLQLRDGVAAGTFIERARTIVETLGRHRAQGSLPFFEAFALLDQGLDQSHLDMHGPDPKKLETAVAKFGEVAASATDAGLRASALVLQAWALAELNKPNDALTALAEAKVLGEKAFMPVTAGNAVYSAMRVYLSQNNYEEVIALGKQPVAARQQLMFLARAHYELKNYAEAARVQAQLKVEFPNQWTAADEERRRVYATSNGTGEHLTLPPEQPAHAVYCESEWAD